MMQHIIRSFVMLLLGVFLLVPSAYAYELQSREHVVLPAGSVSKGSFITAGSTIVIDGEIDGDLYCAGNDITIAGVVSGDVICAGKTISITGEIGGSVRTVSQYLTIDGSMGRQLTAASQDIALTERAHVLGEVFAAFQKSRIAGLVEKDVLLAGEAVDLSGAITGSVRTLVAKLTISETSSIGGDLSYPEDATVIGRPDEAVSGTIRTTERVQGKEEGVKEKPLQEAQRSYSSWFSGRVSSILVWLGVGLLWAAMSGSSLSTLATLLDEKKSRAFLFGILWIMVAPIVSIVIMVTIIGIPVAVLLILIYALVIAISRLIAAVVVGKWLLERFANKQKDSLYLAVLLGVTVSWLVFGIPILGALASFLATCMGAGAILLSFSRQGKVASSRKK